MPPEHMLRVVLDVNVIVSSIIAPSGTPGRIYDAWKRQQLYVITSPVIIAKTLEVIRRPSIQRNFSISEADIQAIKTLLERRTILTPHNLKLTVVERDPEDDNIIIAAVEGKADCIVSGDSHLKDLGSYEDIPILSPSEFVVRYNIQ